MKILDGRELAGFIKERQAYQVRKMTKKPKLLVIRDSDNPVILKYVNLKKTYGADIGVEVEDFCGMICDETVATDPDALYAFLKKTGHPVLQMDPLM